MDKSPSAAPVPKVLSATAGSVTGGAIGVVLPWIFRTYLNTDMPVEVALGFGTILAGAGALLAGYFTPPGGAK